MLAGGPNHPFEETVPALVRVLRDHGIETEVFHDLEAGLARLAQGGFDLLTAHCLRWTMVQHEKYAPIRDEWAFSLSESGRAAARRHVAAGKGVFGIHTAPISFDTWPGWTDILGVGWVWGKSHHPPLGLVAVRMTERDSPIAKGLPEFALTDELYCELAVAPWMQPFMAAHTADDATWRPAGFAGEDGGSRRVYCSFGHDGASITQPTHQALLGRAARWAAGLEN
jgi:type 1 glutamine amidotransferase